MDKTEEFIVYTQHALQRMLFRNITKEMVRETLLNPEQIETGYGSRTLAYKSFGDKRIKVVYVKENEKHIIVSAMWD